MATIALTDSYATVVEAKTYLSIRDDWNSAETKIKEDALLWGRYYIDSAFDCVIDSDSIPDEVKMANSLLAYDYFKQGDLFFDNQDRVILKRIKAEGLEIEKEFSFGRKNKPNSLSKVIAILKPICDFNKGRLVRV